MTRQQSRTDVYCPIHDHLGQWSREEYYPCPVDNNDILVSAKTMSQKEVMLRWPRLTAHMISHSLGYFTPEAAANAILAHVLQMPWYCEWYMDIASHRKADSDDDLYRQINHDCISDAFRLRHHHTGYMRNIEYAMGLVRHVGSGKKGPTLASWM